MNKTAIKNFAVWARKKLMEDTRLKANSLGISGEHIAEKMEHSTKEVHFFEIGLENPLELTGTMLQQRRALVNLIQEKATSSDLPTAFEIVVEEVAYTWFNRLIALRFMEVNNYLPSGVPVLSSNTPEKSEPDLVTNPHSVGFTYDSKEQTFLEELQDKGDSDGLFGFLFVKQCNALNDILPKLFEKTADYTELLLNLSYIKEDSVVSRLVHDIPMEDFQEAVEIVGWLYQYYNTEPKEKVFADLKKNIKITKENIPAATQLFTPDWIVKYMVENSLGRLWLEQNPESPVREHWKYYLEEAPQTPEVAEKLAELRKNHPVTLEEIKFLDPCMGSGHILVYAFDVMMELYLSQGYKARNAVENILKFNLYGLDIDKRAYQLAYFALMMKARQHDARFFIRALSPMVYAPVKHKELENFGSLYKVEELPPEPQEEDFEPLDLLAYTLEEREQNWSFMFVLSQKYEVVCTNPPYMGGSNGNGKLADFMKKEFPDSKGDLFAVFIEKCFRFAKESGFLAMITQHSFMFLSSYEKLRGKLLQKDFINMAHLGARAFEEIGGEVVQTTSFVMRNQKTEGYQSTFARLVDFNSQQEKENEFLTRNHLHIAQQENFSKIPGSPIAYWVSERMLDVFSSNNSFGGVTKKGILTGNDNVYIRLWFEVSQVKISYICSNHQDMLYSGRKWFPVTSGGIKRKWYGNLEAVVNLENDGKSIKENVQNYRLRETTFYMSEAVSWTEVSSGIFSSRYIPQGILFGNGGPVSFFYDNTLKNHLGFLNTKLTMQLLMCLAPTINYGPQQIGKLPIILSEPHKPTIDTLVEENIALSKTDWDSFETSWDFEKHPLRRGNTIESAYQQWENNCQSRFNTLKSNEEELNRIFIEIYGLQEELTPEVEEKDVTVRRADLKRDVKSLLSYAVGCLFGRYSLDCDGLAFAGGDWDESKYQTFTPTKDNCLVICEEQFEDKDLCSQVIEFLKKAYGEDSLQENLDFIATALGTKGDTSRDCINNYFLKEFYKDHLKTYQKRPIYWQFDSGKEGGFKALLYIHRYHQDNLGVIRTDFLHKLQSVYREMIRSAEYDLEHGGKNLKQLEKLQRKLSESSNYEVKLAHLANRRIELDLDDGVKVNYEKLQTAQDGKKIEVLGKI